MMRGLLSLTEDDRRLVATDYLFNLNNYGNVHYEGEHKIHVYMFVIFRARVGAAVKPTAIALTNWLKSPEHGRKT